MWILIYSLFWLYFSITVSFSLRYFIELELLMSFFIYHVRTYALSVYNKCFACIYILGNLDTYCNTYHKIPLLRHTLLYASSHQGQVRSLWWINSCLKLTFDSKENLNKLGYLYHRKLTCSFSAAFNKPSLMRKLYLVDLFTDKNTWFVYWFFSNYKVQLNFYGAE